MLIRSNSCERSLMLHQWCTNLNAKVHAFFLCFFFVLCRTQMRCLIFHHATRHRLVASICRPMWNIGVHIPDLFPVLRSWHYCCAHFKCLNIWIPEFAVDIKRNISIFFFRDESVCFIVKRFASEIENAYKWQWESDKNVLCVAYVMTVVVRVQCNMKHGSAYHNKSESKPNEKETRNARAHWTQCATAKRVYSKWLRLSLPHDRKCFHFDYKLYFIIEIISAEKQHLMCAPQPAAWCDGVSRYVRQKYDTILVPYEAVTPYHGSPHPPGASTLQRWMTTNFEGI